MENLKALRNARNISQKALGETLGVSQQAIYKYEHSLAEPDIYTLIQLASFFNTSVDYLIGNSDDAGAVTYVAPLSPEQRDMVELYSSLPQNVRTAAMTMMRAVANK